MRMSYQANRWILLIVLTTSYAATGLSGTDAQLTGVLPDEYESVGDHVLGLGNAGMAAAAGIASVRLNPAMLAMEPVYTVSGGYHWPRNGRDFYQVGILDSKTSSLAAGMSYTGFADTYNSADAAMAEQLDSPVVRRASVGIAQAFKSLSIGLAGHFVEGVPLTAPTDPLVKGWGLGLGVASLLTPTIRVGASAENLANAKIAEYAPRTLRAGVAWIFGGGDVTAHLDFRQRDRIRSLEAGFAEPMTFGVNDSAAAASEPVLKPEQMVIGSFSARVYDVVRILGAYGQSANSDGRRLLAGGIAIVNNQVSISYGASREDMRDQSAHHAVNLNMSISL